MNKYNTWYDNIISNSQKRTTDDYTESHHIIPESLDGPDTPENRTALTAREHFICHWLLTKIHTTGDAHWKMLNALRIMRAENKNQTRYKTKITSRVYEKLKKEYALLQSEKMRGTNNPMYGKPVSEEVRKGRSERATGENNPAKRLGAAAKISKAQTGKIRKPFSDEWKAKMSASASGENNSRYGVTLSDDIRKKISDKMTGRKQSAETIAKKAEAVRGSKREKQACTCCGKLVPVNVLNRWHNKNCRAD